MKFILLISLFLLISCSSRMKVNNPFYYEVTKDDKVMHVLGTMHVRFELSDFHPQVQKDISHAEKICLEVDEEVIAGYRSIYQKDYTNYAKRHFTKPYPLADKISPEGMKNLLFTLRMDEVRKLLNTWSITASPTELNPLLAMEVINDLIRRQQTYAFPPIVFERSNRHDLKWLTHDFENQLDMEILKYARAEKKTVFALDEIPEEGAFSEAEIEDKGLAFIETLYGKEPEGLNTFNRLKSAYQIGDEKELLQLLSEQKENDLKLVERNKLWVSKIKWALEKRLFVAVGALHLVGKDNFLEFLTREGYSVKKIILKDHK